MATGDMMSKRYWITPEGIAALERYAKEHPEDDQDPS